MKSLMTIVALALLAGCSGMETSGGHMDRMHYQAPVDQSTDPTSPYFFGQG